MARSKVRSSGWSTRNRLARVVGARELALGLATSPVPPSAEGSAIAGRSAAPAADGVVAVTAAPTRPVDPALHVHDAGLPGDQGGKDG